MSSLSSSARFACVWVVLSVASSSACAVEDLRPRDLAASEDPLIRGEYTYERPEVGSISGCTATLVGPRLVVTAAHCLGYGSRTSPGRYGTFNIRRRSGDSQRYTIERYVSYASSLGADDVAIIRLASEVPTDVATPARLASTNPGEGSGVTIYGYGCQRRGTSGSWAKQKVRVSWGRSSANLCPGDSGGPTMTDDGQVVRVNSGYWLDSEGLDIFGSVPRVYSRIARTVAGWGDSLGGGSPLPMPSDAGAPDASRAPDAWTMSPPPPPPEPDPENPCAQPTCAEATALPGCGWCDATGRGIRVGGMGEALEPCARGFRVDPGDCGTTERSTCGPWADYPDYTCRRNRTQFVRCTEGNAPEFLTCPSGYTCNPGSTVRRCYR
jgi:hypothetical protein